MAAEIELRYVTKIYVSSSKRTLAVADVSFTVEPGEFFSIVGPSGCGKTTLINLIAGFIEPTSGSVKVNGNPVRGPGADRAVVFQNYGLFNWKTVRGNVEFGLKAKSVSRTERQQIVKKYLDLVHLTDFADRYPSELSAGMQQRVALVRALAVDPECVLMDEPLGSLDSQMRLVLQDEIALIWQETRQTILMVTHDMEEAIYLSDGILVLSTRPGRVCAEIRVELPRPRPADVRMSMAFQDIRRKILAHLVDR